MLQLKKSLLLLVLLVSQSLYAYGFTKSTGVDSGEKEYLDNAVKLYQFLTDHVVGVKFRGGLTGKTLDDKYEFDFIKTNILSNLKISDSGLSFSEINYVRHRDYELKDGNRTDLEINHDRFLVSSCEISEKESSSELLGFCKSNVNVGSDVTGEVFYLRVLEISEKTLVLEETQIGYSDASFDDKKVLPISTKITHHYTVSDDNTVEIRMNIKIFDVKPEYKDDIQGYERTLRREETIKLYEI